MRRTKDEAEATRTAIIKAGLKIFAAIGPESANLQSVAEAAGVTRGAIYWHFRNKWDLLDAIMEHFTTPVNTFGLDSPEAPQPDPLGDIAQMIDRLLTHVARDEVYRNVFRLQAHLSSVRNQTRSHGQSRHRRFEQMMALKHRYRCIALENAKRCGQLPDDLDVQAGACYISAMIEGLVTNYLAMPELYDLESRAGQFTEVIMIGLKQGLKGLGPAPAP